MAVAKKKKKVGEEEMGKKMDNLSVINRLFKMPIRKQVQ